MWRRLQTILKSRSGEEDLRELLGVADRYIMPVLRNALVAAAASAECAPETKGLSKELRDEISQLKKGFKGVTSLTPPAPASLSTTV